MKTNKFVVGFVLLSALLLTSCGGSGGGGPDKPADTDNSGAEHTDPTTTALNITVPDSIDLNNGRYNIAGGFESVSATGETIKIAKDDKAVVSLLKGNYVILSGRKYPGDSEVDVSLESSAVVMVLMQPRFFGTSSTKPKELEKRIKAHDGFSELAKAIKVEIERGSSCPLDSMCNPEANEFADKIATEIKISDLF